MSVNIHLNLYAQSTVRQVKTHYYRLADSVRRLSTGSKVNSAEDSPTVKAIQSNLRSEVEALRKGMQNAQLALNAVQNSESAMQSIGNNLSRMRELAEQAATGSYTNSQRNIINSEFQTLALEIDRLSSSTNFNGIKLLDGSVSTIFDKGFVPSDKGYAASGHFTKDESLKVHFGSGNNRTEDYYYIKLTPLSMNSLFADYIDPNDANADTSAKVVSVETQTQAQNALEQLETAFNVRSNAQAYMGFAQQKLESVINEYEEQAENISGLESTLTDIDIAEEYTNYTKELMMAQASTSILAQANSLPQMALKLLG